MNIIEEPVELQRALAPIRQQEHIGFVPTMGCLHEGHLSLIRKAKRLADIVVVSIYVNPLQFGPNEDFEAYPRVFEQDAQLCENEGVDFLFHPQNLYPDDGPKITLKVDTLDQQLCGTKRTGHFDGVATIVNILLNIVQPNIAIFGEKDWQQLTIIRRMVHDLHMPVDIIGGKTLREENGLAMSSRNRYLTDDERKLAAILHLSLQAMNDRDSNCETLIQQARKILKQHHIQAEYLEIRHADTLETLNSIKDSPARAFIAASIGKARLIDNIALQSEKS
ncbi:MAG: pantoate--beta-alanine ligase [Mariprofundaceae bacterium]